MPKDQELSQLISKSLRHQLSAEESKKVQKHLDESEEARKFAQLSQMIQKSVSGLKADTAKDSVRMTTEMKAKMRDSIAVAVREKLSISKISQSGMDRDMTMASDSARKVMSESFEDNSRKLNSRFA